MPKNNKQKINDTVESIKKDISSINEKLEKCKDLAKEDGYDIGFSLLSNLSRDNVYMQFYVKKCADIGEFKNISHEGYI